MSIQFQALPTDTVTAIRTTGLDAHGHPVERHRSDGGAYPCRHCLGETPPGQDYLILAHRPFQRLHAYTETGPIFLCADACTRAAPSPHVPAILKSPSYILRGYDAKERIIYGTGQVTPTNLIADYATQLLALADIAFVDVRSAANNCFQCRVVRAG
ncbi:DUF1203 domain-containing protein [Shimia aestuarii]|uniref:DUF1203 domain-containing protein n=1 Tax=Shimia aestuarii TaxID=254406 RepID=A0A1I4QZR1_9RHOB|nr:DUF1203 domain-containing protein [Shimia aestuarii]SFM45173.1 Protein of unknown function [Shimia aestuarii]